MKKRLLFKKSAIALSAFFISLAFASNTQAQSFTWAKNMGGASLDNGLSIAVDASGNVYTTGYFQGTADFDPGAGVSNLTSMGGTDIFISKVNSSGNFVWAKQIGGSSFDYGRSIKVDASGNVYTTGHFNGSVDFNPGAGTFSLTTTGPDDIFVSKLDASGNFVWAKQMGGANADFAYAIALDASGNVYTTGSFNIGADFNPGAATFNLFSSGGYDIFVSKLDANGNFVWAKNMGSSLQDFGICLTLDASGNVYTSGYFEGTADFDPSAASFTMTSVNARDIFISKLDASGNFVWAKQIGGGGNQTANAITTDANGNVYTTGSFAGVADFDPSVASYTIPVFGGLGEDIFISKLDASGNFVWAKSMGGIGFDISRGITIGAAGDVYTTGEFYSTVDFNPGVGTYTVAGLSSSNDAFISKLDANGNFVSAKSIGSASGAAYGNAIVCDASNNLYATGYFSGTTDFDPDAGVFNLVPPGTQPDVFVLKMNPLSSGISETNGSLKAILYPNPANLLLNIKTEETIESVTVYNVLGTVVMEEKTNSFSVEHLPVGVYTLKIKTENGLGLVRFIKE